MSAPPLTPDRDEARRWAERELSDPQYRDADLSPLEKIGRAINRLTNSIFERLGEIDSPWMLLIVGALIALIVGLIIWRVRRGTSGGVDLAAFDPARRRTTVDPQAFWDAAYAAADRREYTLAVQNGVRGIFARLVRAEIIEMTAASTASELAHAAGSACPPVAADALAAGTLFDSVTFGEAHATEADWTELLARAERIAAGSAHAGSRDAGRSTQPAGAAGSQAGNPAGTSGPAAGEQLTASGAGAAGSAAGASGAGPAGSAAGASGTEVSR